MIDLPARFLFDFSSANSYLSHLAIGGIEQRTGNEIDYVVVAREFLDGSYQSDRVSAPLDLALRVAIVAQRLGCLPACADAVFAAAWEKGLDIKDEAVLREAMTGLGTDVDVLLSAAKTAETRNQLVFQSEQASQRGVRELPTFIVGTTRISGATALAAAETEILEYRAERMMGGFA